MRTLAACLLLLAAVPASAQVPQNANPGSGARPGNDIGTGESLPLSTRPGNITPSDTTSPIAGRLPEPSAGEDSSTLGYLLAARDALAGGQDGEAQEALERAETRSLDRSVPLFQTGTPSRKPVVEQIHAALQALGNGDRDLAARLIDDAITAAGP